jgi:hypothetical protein
MMYDRGEKIGKLKSQSVSECHHSALINMYKSYKIDLPRSWGGDHIKITIPRHKGDQTGENGLKLSAFMLIH